MRAALAACVGRTPDDPDAHLAADLLLATWTVAFRQAHLIFRRSEDPAEAKAACLAMIDRRARGVDAALAGIPYAEAIDAPVRA